MDRRTTQNQEVRRTLLKGVAAVFGLTAVNSLPGVVRATEVKCGDQILPCYEGPVKGAFNAYRVVLIPSEGADDNEITLNDKLIDRLRGTQFQVTSSNIPDFSLTLESADDGLCVRPQKPSETTILVETDTRSSRLELVMLPNRIASERPGLVPTWVADLDFTNLKNGSVFRGRLPLCPADIAPEIQQWPSGIRADQVTDGSLRDYPLVLEVIHKFRRTK